MKKKQKLKLLTTLSLCFFMLSSFTSKDENGEDLSQSRFDYEVERLDVDLDRTAAVGSEAVDLENQLSEKDCHLIQEFISIGEAGIELDDRVCSVMPTNDDGLPIKAFQEKSGCGYQKGNSVYFHNYQTLDFVSDNIGLMNEMVENGYGKIDKDGMLLIESSDFIQQSFFMNFKIGWFKISFRTNYWGTALFGTFGLLVNFDNIRDMNALFDADASELGHCFQSVAWDLISEGESYFGNVMLDSLTEAVNTVVEIKKIVLCSNWIGRLVMVVKYMLGRYLPGLLKGLVMVLGSVFYRYGTDVEIGIWWSDYDVLTCSVY